MKILDENFKNKQGQDFISRDLNDTRYIATLVSNFTKDYLDFLPLSKDEDTSLKSTEKRK